VYLWQYATFTDNVFRDNFASTASGGYGQGGAFYLHEVWGASLDANRFADNTATADGVYGYGGAIYGSAGVVFTMTNNLVVGNHASGSGGGLRLDTYSGKLIVGTLINNTIADNDRGSGGEGILVGDYVTLTLQNNLIAGHTVGITDTSVTNTVSADTNLFWNDADPFVGTNPIQQDPRLTSDYRLREGSPALNAGLNVPGLTTDIEGGPRPWDEYDIGAYEGEWWEVFVPLVMRGYP
jgi:hypothetical protein